jgi:hypothetical protein
VAALVEILAYYIPGVDNLLDVSATCRRRRRHAGLGVAVITDLPPSGNG